MQKLTSECPICKKPHYGNLGEHIRSQHSEKEFKESVLKAKEKGIPDPEIGTLFGITFRQLEEIITEAYGINISVLTKLRKIKYWEPKNFREDTTTVWSFKQRGDWATHDGRYRGNWAPYIPRNVILKYSKPGDIVLDYFVGGGTTAVEAKLLGRRCIARDINPACIGLTLENLKFSPPTTLFPFSIYEPDVSVSDARSLSHISDNSIDLICAHPPYAGIINYSSSVEGDLSKLGVKDFLKEIKKVASESYRVLKPSGKCAILIGDTRKHKHVIPIGFQTINVFLEAGFKIRELVIKRQHNCKTTGFWYEKSTKYNFLLLAHEYLPIFEKPESLAPSLALREESLDYGGVIPAFEKIPLKKIDELETTTVWLFPERDLEERLNKNVINRYSIGGKYSTINFNVNFENQASFTKEDGKKKIDLLFIKATFLNNNPLKPNIEHYLEEIRQTVIQSLPNVNKGGFLVVQTQDVRMDGFIEPLGKRIVDLIVSDNLWLKEIVVVAQEEQKTDNEIKEVEKDNNLKITHQYLLIYEVVK
ncbi:MAG: DNA methyltransferase [Acidobacteriota bacterium]